MKRFIAIIAALALSVSLASCGSNNQADSVALSDLIKEACQSAIKDKYQVVVDSFAEIAALDSGYLTAAQGANYWARYNQQFRESPGNRLDNNNLEAFYALCGF